MILSSDSPSELATSLFIIAVASELRMYLFDEFSSCPLILAAFVAVEPSVLFYSVVLFVSLVT